MPIRVAPWEAISENDIVALKARGVPESQTMEYKRGCDLDDREQRFEFVKDVTAMANAAGGTIVYGVEEGEGEEQGFIVSFPGMSGSPGEFHERVDNLLQTSVDERIPGVLHRAVEREHGGFYYLVRIPSSLLAPHMIVMRTSNPRFHARGTGRAQARGGRRRCA